jgi:hypothetical protein
MKIALLPGDAGRAEEVAGRHADALQELSGIPLRSELQPDIDQRTQARVGRSQVVGFLRELVREQP